MPPVIAGIKTGISSGLTWGASSLWSLGSAVLRRAADRGLLRAQKLSARVVSVGNIQAGGAGKTPLVAQIAREAAERGVCVCILTRGYGGVWESTGGILEPGETAADPNLCGDEAALLHELAPRAWIGVGADRVARFRAVAESARVRGLRAPELVVLDDGFQHWKIRKDVEIVAVTEATPGQRVFRESAQSLARADLVVLTKGVFPPGGPQAARGRPLARVRYRIPDGGGARADLVTGVADGKSVLNLVRSSGYRVERHFEFGDHVRYDRRAIDSILASAKSRDCRVCLTGKDWVKWRQLGVEPRDVTVLEPQLQFEEGRDAWERVLWGAP